MSVNGAKIARLGSARLGSARLGSARLGSARLGSARRVVLRLLLSVLSSITSNYCVKSGNRVYYALFSDFFFCGKGDHC